MTTLTLDTSCVMNLLRTEEEVDEALLRVLRLAFAGRVTIAVTHVVKVEVPPSSPSYIRDRLEAFPALDVSPERVQEHNRLADVFARTLWPNANPTSAKSDHNRRDSRHLAAHKLCGRAIFLTRDEPLKKKVAQHPGLGVVVRSPSEVIQELALEDGPRARPMRFDIAVRAARDDDADAIKRLLFPVRDLYPEFDAWLQKTLSSVDTRVALGVVQGEVAAISVWKPKDRRVAKLATFFIAENYRQEGLGPHLLFHQLREWVDARIEKVVVTVASRLATVVPFFLQYGFRIEGLSGRRYQAGEPEVVLAKHFLYEHVPGASLAKFAERVTDVFVAPDSAVLRAVSSWFVSPTAATSLRIDAAENRANVCDADGGIVRSMSLGELEELFYPVRLGTDDRGAYLIPIRPEWASRMVQHYDATPAQVSLFADPVDKLLLRTDNAYYCFPRYGPARLNHAPVLFYVSGNVGAVTGMARVLECRVDAPEELFLRFGDIGAYSLNDVRGHVQKRGAEKGRAMALRFGWWVPLPRAVTLQHLRQLGLAHPQSIVGIDYKAYEAILSAGGLEW